MRTRGEIFNDVQNLIRNEMKTIVRHRMTGKEELFWIIADYRADIQAMLNEAAEFRDIGLLLDIERTVMELELEHVASDADNIKSLRRGIFQVNAATIMLNRVQDPDEYWRVVFYYTLSGDLVHQTDLPKDAAYKFFGSQRARLLNSKSDMNESERTDLFRIRRNYLLQARKDYMELQRQTMEAIQARGQVASASEVRETAAPANLETHQPPLGIREPRKQYRVAQERQIAA